MLTAEELIAKRQFEKEKIRVKQRTTKREWNRRRRVEHPELFLTPRKVIKTQK